MNVKKLQVLGKEVVLPAPLEEDEIMDKDTLITLLKELDEEIANQLENVEFTITIEQTTAVIVRASAVMG